MTQTVPATCVLGPGKTGLAIGLRVLNLDGTEYSAFSTTGVAETSTAGTYRKAGGVVAPLAGGYIVWGTALVDYAEATVESAAVNVTYSAGVAVSGRLAEVTDLPSEPLDATATQAAAAAALTAYDPPTNAEMEARTLVAASYATAAALDAVDNYVDTEIAAIKAKTDNLPSDPADQSVVEAAITAATSTLATAANLATLAGYVDTEVAAILAAVDTEVAAIKAKTDNLPASPAAVGSAMTLTAAYDAAKTAATQTSVDDLPTNAELAAALAAADDAMLAAIADVPTVAEFEARTLPAADYTVVSDLPSVASVADAVWDEAIAGHAVAGSTGAALAAATAPSAASIADAVWDEAIAGHAVAGSTGAALAAAGSAGDPWSTPLPGAYGAGTAGKLLADLPTATEVVAAMDADPPAVNVTHHAGVAVAAADANGNVPVVLYGTQPSVTFGKITLNSGGYQPALHIMSGLSNAISGATGLMVGLTSSGVAQVTDAVPDAQDIADALLLAPSGAAAAGSAMAELAAILEDTGTTLPAAIAGISAAGDPWSTALPGAYGAGTAGKLLADLPTATEVVAAMDADPPAVNVTHHAGVAVAAADLNGNVPVIVKAWYDTPVPEPNTAGYPDIGTLADISLQVSQQVRDAMKLAPSVGAAGAGSVDAKLDDILTTIGSEIVEGTYTRDDILRIIAAALAGETSGSGTATVEILGLDGATTRITATLDGNGNRTSMTLDGT